jgi:hypothetical protein
LIAFHTGRFRSTISLKDWIASALKMKTKTSEVGRREIKSVGIREFAKFSSISGANLEQIFFF